MNYMYKNNILIKNSRDEMYMFNLGNDIVYTKLDSNFNKLYSNKLSEGCFSFVDVWLNIDNEDKIYGVLNNKKGKLLEVEIKENDTDEYLLFKYDYKNFSIKFPYLEKINNEDHIIYYLINKKNPYYTSLLHIYKCDDKYIRNKIDYLNYNIMSNFIVTFNETTPSIFYFKYINNCEELFMSTFNLDTLKWSSPYQITNSKKNKIYLSSIKDNNGTYHIVFSEKNNNKYFCKHLKGNIINDTFQVMKESFVSYNLMCIFPSLIEQNSNIYIQWVEYFNLYTSKSKDYGDTWSLPILDKSISDFPFVLYEFRSAKDNFNSAFGIRNYMHLKKFFDFK